MVHRTNETGESKSKATRNKNTDGKREKGTGNREDHDHYIDKYSHRTTSIIDQETIHHSISNRLNNLSRAY